MSAKPLDRILITNDDGIDAPGLAVLEEVANDLAHEVWVVAPDHDQSGISHALSLHHPLRVTPRGERRFSVSGTPADCVAVGLRQLLDAPPQLLLSGVNKGGNLGVETMFSGTVGAAMAGLLMGVPSIALSQFFTRREAVRWDTARQLAPGVIRQLLSQEWAGAVCMNVNFPDVPAEQAAPLRITRQGKGRMSGLTISERTDMREQDYYWLSIHRDNEDDYEDSETVVVLAGGVSATPLRFERTDVDVMGRLLGRLGSQERACSRLSQQD